MPKPRPVSVQTSEPAETQPDARAGAKRRAFVTYAGDNEASPRAGLVRRTEPGDAPADESSAPTAKE